MRRSGTDLLLTHAGDLIDLFAEFGRIGIDRDQIGNEAVDLLVELRLLFGRNGDQPGGFVQGNFGHRIGRGQLEIGRGPGRGFGGGFQLVLGAHALVLAPSSCGSMTGAARSPQSA